MKEPKLWLNFVRFFTACAPLVLREKLLFWNHLDFKAGVIAAGFAEFHGNETNGLAQRTVWLGVLVVDLLQRCACGVSDCVWLYRLSGVFGRPSFGFDQ